MSRIGTHRLETCGALLVTRVLPVVFYSNSLRTLVQIHYCCYVPEALQVQRVQAGSCTLKLGTAMETASVDRSKTGGQINGGQWVGVKSQRNNRGWLAGWSEVDEKQQRRVLV